MKALLVLMVVVLFCVSFAAVFVPQPVSEPQASMVQVAPALAAPVVSVARVNVDTLSGEES